MVTNNMEPLKYDMTELNKGKYKNNDFSIDTLLSILLINQEKDRKPIPLLKRKIHILYIFKYKTAKLSLIRKNIVSLQNENYAYLTRLNHILSKQLRYDY